MFSIFPPPKVANIWLKTLTRGCFLAISRFLYHFSLIFGAKNSLCSQTRFRFGAKGSPSPQADFRLRAIPSLNTQTRFRSIAITLLNTQTIFRYTARGIFCERLLAFCIPLMAISSQAELSYLSKINIKELRNEVCLYFN